MKHGAYVLLSPDRKLRAAGLFALRKNSICIVTYLIHPATANRVKVPGTGTPSTDRCAAQPYLLSPFRSRAQIRKRPQHRRLVSGHCADSAPARSDCSVEKLMH